MRSRACTTLRAALTPLLGTLLLAPPAPAQRPASEPRPDTIVVGPLIGIHWPGGRRLAQHLLELTRDAPPLPALPTDIVESGEPIRIILAPDPQRFDSLTGGRAPEWGAGIAIPAAAVIVLPGYVSDRGAPNELARTLRHELAHVALHRFLAPARPPRWFDEGFARVAAGEWDLDAAWQLRLAFASGRAPDLDSLTLGWPRAEADARIAYLLATTAVSFLLQHGGEDGLRVLLERWKATGSLDTALRRTYGLTLGQFEEDWRTEVRHNYGWLYFLIHSVLFWFFCGLLVLLLFIRRTHENRIRLARLRATEPPDRPAYWLGEIDDETGPPDTPSTA